MFLFYDWPVDILADAYSARKLNIFSTLILGSFFSDVVVFYGDYILLRDFWRFDHENGKQYQ